MSSRSVEVIELEPGRSTEVVQQHYVTSASSIRRTSSSEASLPPVDRGKGAWFFLAACWVVETFVFGKYLLLYVCRGTSLPGNKKVSAFLLVSTRTSTARTSPL